MSRVLPLTVAAVMGAALLAGCAAPPPEPTPVPEVSTPPAEPDAVQPAGTPIDVVTGLTSPWSIVRVRPGEADSSALVSQRNDGAIMLMLPDANSAKGAFTVQRLGTIPGVFHANEGGLLGLAYLEDGTTQWLYAYETTKNDNRIVRFDMGSDAGLEGEPEVILKGILSGTNHNGGRIAFGPDGMLYATAGEVGDREESQDKNSLNGKILRMTPTGAVPPDNPFPGSLVYSMGHRNPQGLTWDENGQLWAAEFGQDTWDEFNRIEPGGNYGWPVVEGAADREGFIDPWAQWPTDEASPSGLTYISGTFFMAGLGGERLWAIYVEEEAGTATSVPWYVGEYGRIRDVVPGPDGTLWMLTNNTDGRGDPRGGDDRILQVQLTELVPSPENEG